jgi:hypothetical protein
MSLRLKLPPRTCKLYDCSNRRHLGRSSCQVGTHLSHDLLQKPSTYRTDPAHLKQTNITLHSDTGVMAQDCTVQSRIHSQAQIGVSSATTKTASEDLCDVEPDFWKRSNSKAFWDMKLRRFINNNGICGELCCLDLHSCPKNTTLNPKVGKTSISASNLNLRVGSLIFDNLHFENCL